MTVVERGSLSLSDDLQKLDQVRASEFTMDPEVAAASRFTEKKKTKTKTTRREPTTHNHSEVDGSFLRELKKGSAATTKQQENDREIEEGSLESTFTTTLYSCKSPKSAEKVQCWTTKMTIGGIVHHQILKIREEDSLLGEEIREGLSTKEKLAVLHLTSQMDDSFILNSCRPILPSSPLSGKIH